MDDQRKAEITRLAEDAHNKRIRYQALGMMNTPSDPDEKRKAAVEYALAHAELIEAEELLDHAKHETPLELSKRYSDVAAKYNLPG